MEIGAVPHHICFALPPASPDHLARNLREQPPAAAPASSAPASDAFRRCSVRWRNAYQTERGSHNVAAKRLMVGIRTAGYYDSGIMMLLLSRGTDHVNRQCFTNRSCYLIV
ncbi:hypothetical protein SETIT_9G564100v2 [Setaria italica]|uniref:Uncharacterized protein n=1 Tax=Setaria italica TaxID=4555 RepID=A0A368SZH9_SETIT|nr:hypothetical protein SETIT_9G564100v2 [Setaria italica]